MDSPSPAASADPSSAEITSHSKSNLAFTLRFVPEDRRQDLISFYAFCRIIDDLADDLELPLEDKERGLSGWHQVILSGQTDPSLKSLNVQEETLAVQKRYNIPQEYFLNIIQGCQDDLSPRRYQTWEELQRYTFNVACSVGLVCLPIFGADAHRSHDYAVALGHALQLTNILRDIGEDLVNGERIYVPLQDATECSYTEADFLARTHDVRFIKFMNAQAARAEEYYHKASSLLPREDFKALAAPRAMHAIYHRLLRKMKADQFQVFDRRYRVHRVTKMGLLLKEMLRSA